LLGKYVNATNGSLTLVFHSDGSVDLDGFTAEITCIYPCQEFSIDLSGDLLDYFNSESNTYDICAGSQIQLSAIGNYPNNDLNYSQTDENVSWKWEVTSINILDTMEGIGLSTIDYTFDTPGGYMIKILATDSNNCIFQTERFIVRTSLVPSLSFDIPDQNTCLGTEFELNGLFTPSIFYWEQLNSNFEEICFADEVGIWQSSCFNISALSNLSYIESADDIESICLNIEHSYIGDLDIVIECPSGQSVSLFEQACGNTCFGEPNHNDDCVPGVGMDYCWTMDAYNQISENSNPGNSLVEGNYLPFESFDGLVGCPVDGEWCLRILDNLGLDDGTVFFVDVNFAGGTISDNDSIWVYANSFDISSESTDIYWSGENVIATDTGNAIAIPEEAGEYEYTFTVIDNWGCLYDTALNVTVLELDDTICGFLCDNETITSLEGVINDGSGDDYLSQNDANCSWLISPETKSNGLIVLHWNYFEVYENDTVKIFNGADENSPLIGEYTEGSELPSSMLTFGHEAYITYATDSEDRSPGWEISYQSTLVNLDNTDAIEPYLFPNPASNKLSIYGINQTCELSIFDHVGAEYLSIPKFENGEVDISNLTTGLYLVKISSDSEVKILRFLKE